MSCPSTAPVLEYRVLWTHHKTQKIKSYNDGFLKFHVFNKRAMLYDDSRRLVDSTFITGASIQVDRELTFDRVLCTVEEFLSSADQDLSSVVKKHRPTATQESPQNDMRRSSNRENSLASVLPVNSLPGRKGLPRLGLSKRKDISSRSTPYVRSDNTELPAGCSGQTDLRTTRHSTVLRGSASDILHGTPLKALSDVEINKSAQLPIHSLEMHLPTVLNPPRSRLRNANVSAASQKSRVVKPNRGKDEEQRLQIQISLSPKKKRDLLCLGKPSSSGPAERKSSVGTCGKRRCAHATTVAKPQSETVILDNDDEEPNHIIAIDLTESSAAESKKVGTTINLDSELSQKSPVLSSNVMAATSLHENESFEADLNLEDFDLAYQTLSSNFCPASNPANVVEADQNDSRKENNSQTAVLQSAWEDEETFDLFSWRPAKHLV